MDGVSIGVLPEGREAAETLINNFGSLVIAQPIIDSTIET